VRATVVLPAFAEKFDGAAGAETVDEELEELELEELEDDETEDKDEDDEDAEDALSPLPPQPASITRHPVSNDSRNAAKLERFLNITDSLGMRQDKIVGTRSPILILLLNENTDVVNPAVNL
jgi:hypothetical protein